MNESERAIVLGELVANDDEKKRLMKLRQKENEQGIFCVNDKNDEVYFIRREDIVTLDCEELITAVEASFQKDINFQTHFILAAFVNCSCYIQTYPWR
jgi:hypothetical protein